MKESLELNHHPLIQDAELAKYMKKNNLWQTNINQNLLASTTDMMNDIWMDAHGVKRILENDVISPDNTSAEGKVISIIDLPVEGWHLLRQDVYDNIPYLTMPEILFYEFPNSYNYNLYCIR